MMEAPELIYSPKEHIPIGEPVIFPNGGHGLRLKWRRGKRNVTETVSLDTLHELVAHGNKKTSEQESQ